MARRAKSLFCPYPQLEAATMRRTTLLVMAMVAATLVSGVLVGYDSASAQSTAAVTGTIRW